MIVTKETFNKMLNSPVRKQQARVEIYQGSTLALICGCHDRLKSFTIERVGEQSKFFGFGICQKLNAHLLDPHRELSVTTANTLEVEFGVGSDYIYPCPNFYVTEVNRDENTNELSITAYDALYKAAEHTVAEVALPIPYNIREFAAACAAVLGIPLALDSVTDSAFDTSYAEGANFNGTETIRAALDAVAEATQTIYFIDNNWNLRFKRLDAAGSAVATIDKNNYFKLDSKSNRRLTEIIHATQLGDNIGAALAVSGSTQYVRDNPFWELRDDIATLVENALAAIGGLTINQFNCNWRGNYLLEIGDKIELVTKDHDTITSYLLDDVIAFNGALSGKTQWQYVDNETETAANPTTLGEALKVTYAKVDKVNKTVEIVAAESSANAEKISAIDMTTTNITATVEEVQNEVSSANDEITQIKEQVSATVTKEELSIEIRKELASGGVNKVVTSTTGYTFDDSGLTISKSDSEISTQITEDGMSITKGSDEVLTANNEGVKAIDLHAATYLIVGNNSRFEDYGYNRTGCFWIKGANS